MAFVVGQIVRPKRSWLLSSGVAVDFWAMRSAQACVLTVDGNGAANGGTVFDPDTSVSAATARAGVDRYTVRVWDVDLGNFYSRQYAEEDLDAGTIGNGLIVGTFPDPVATNNANSIRICRARD